MVNLCGEPWPERITVADQCQGEVSATCATTESVLDCTKGDRIRLMRERGIYKAPENTEYVASKGPDSIYFLFELNRWVTHGAVGLRVNEDGSVSRHGHPTGMRVEDFKDTGRTADPAPTYP